ncbi:MAG: hypothetical protein NVSMB62_22190 [Acidobacteriaceae bacterium]
MLIPLVYAVPNQRAEGSTSVDSINLVYPERGGNRQSTKNPTEQEAYNTRAPHIPLKVEWLTPKDLTPAAVFLASDLAAMVTGPATPLPAETTLRIKASLAADRDAEKARHPPSPFCTFIRCYSVGFHVTMAVTKRIPYKITRTNPFRSSQDSRSCGALMQISFALS